MKKLSVTIQVAFEVPESWEVVEHPDQIQAIRMDNGYFMNMSYLPMLTKEFTPGAVWSSESPDNFNDELWDMVLKEELKMELE